MRALKFKGNRVYVNRAKLNEGATERLAKHIQNGWYSHESTEDNVEIYVLSDKCPFRKRSIEHEELGLHQLMTELVELAKARDFDNYVNGVNELAYEYKSLGMEKSDFLDVMLRIEAIAARESGSIMLPYELRSHLEMARQKRNGTIIAV